MFLTSSEKYYTDFSFMLKSSFELRIYVDISIPNVKVELKRNINCSNFLVNISFFYCNVVICKRQVGKTFLNYNNKLGHIFGI